MLRDFDDTSDLALRDLIADRIRASGPITFVEFLELDLYHPTRGYYFTQDPARDYQSSPNLHPIFGAGIARALASFWQALGRPQRFDVFEAGANTGRLAADVLRGLRLESPECYAAIRYVLQDVILAHEGGPTRLEAVSLPEGKWAVAADLPAEASIDGCILSNELLDALPFHRVRRREGTLYELRVGLGDEGAFVDVEAPLSPAIETYLAELGATPAEGCEAEVNLAAPAWTRRAAAALRRGFVLTLDYGYDAEQLYASWRKRGTLLTFYRHTSDDRAYARIGRQDITASVDFTAVRRAGEAAGMQTVEYTTQGEFLAGLGIGEVLTQQPGAGEIEAYMRLRRAVMELTDPSGLGRIKVLLQSKGVAQG